MITKQEIEDVIKGKDDFVKISYLNRYLRQVDSMEMKKFILLHLATVNESRGMYNDAIKNVASAGDISLTYREKRELYMKEVALWIKIGEFMMAEKAFHKVLGYTNDIERIDAQELYENTFRAIGKNFIDEGKYRKALDVYEKLISITKVSRRKNEVKDKLLEVYEKLGKIREYNRLRDSVF